MTFDLSRLNKGWSTTESGEVEDAFLEENDLLVVRGMIVDGIFPNTREGREIVRKAEIRANKKKKK